MEESKKTKNKNNKEEKEKTKKYNTKGKNKKVKTEKVKKKHRKLKKAIKILAVLFVLLCIVGAGVVAGIVFSDEYKISKDDLMIEFSNSSVYDINGELIGKFSGEEDNREIIGMKDMGYLPKAFVAIEDRKFYDHHGVDLLRTGYVTVKYFINKGESSSGGGSTITQQLVKNLMNDKDDSGLAGIKRKVREISRAYQVENILSKDQILELYLNLIYLGGYGKNIKGVETASKYYFNKSAKDLDIAESAFIAGINHAPNAYNPFEGKDNGDKIKKRTKLVLSEMKEKGSINEEEYNLAVEKVEGGLPFSEGTTTNNNNYSYTVAAARKEIINDLVEQKGWDSDYASLKLNSGGYKIYTTQDTKIQKRMEEEYAKDRYIINGKEKKDGKLINEGHTQSAMVIIDHTTGHVIGTMGGLGTDSNALGLNRATSSKIQPGSSMKPIGVVAPALVKGVVTSGTVYDDSETDFGGNYIPHNSDNSFSGLITVSKGITISSNIVNLKIIRELGPNNALEFLKTMGVTSINEEPDITLALGSYGVSPLEMAAAYATIANDGVYIEPTFYTKVEDSSGNVVLEPKQEKHEVMSKENAYIMKQILKGPVTSGTASNCSISGMDVGAKTGSTNGYRDRWLCGFTPYYTAATWFGFDNPEKPSGVSGNVASKIWIAIMSDAHKDLTGKKFEKPDNVVSLTICTDSGKKATESCTHKSTEYYLKGTEPGYCDGHIKQTICKESQKIANEYCPNKEEITYLAKPEKENTKLWTTKDGGKYKAPITEICDIHKKPEDKPPQNEINNNIVEEPVEEKVKVPNLVGMSEASAKTEIKKAKLNVTVEYKEVTSGENGKVLNQSIAKGTEVSEGTTIKITVSKLKAEEPKQNIIANTVETED